MRTRRGRYLAGDAARPMAFCLVRIGTLSLSVCLLIAWFGCTASSSSESPSNLTRGEQDGLEALAADIANAGDLRPVLPAYLPLGIDPSPEVIGQGERFITLQFGAAGGTESQPAPLELIIAQELYDGASLLLCDSDSAQEGLEGPDLACVQLNGLKADLQTTIHPEGIAQHSLQFELEDRRIYLELAWRPGESPGTEEMKREIMLVGESILRGG